MVVKLWFGVLALTSAIVLSSCSGSSNQRSEVLPQTQQAETVLQPAATTSVKITEYPVLRGPQNPAIGPDGAVWFGAAGPNSTGPIYVYRFAANDGQGRYYALSSLLKSDYLLTGVWTQVGPLVSFGGRMWTSFEAQPHDWADLEHQGGLIEMTASGTALNANVLLGSMDVGGAAVQGNSLWLLPTNYISLGDSSIRSYTLKNGSLNRGPTYYTYFEHIIEGDALRIGPDGNIYALLVTFDFSGIWKISSSAQLIAAYQLNNFDPVDMAFGSDGAMWITTSSQLTSGIPYIIRMTANGTRAIYKIPYAGASPTAITLGHDGAMWFVDAGTNAIGRISMTGVITEYPVPTRNAFVGLNGVPAGGIVACPTSIAACGSGDIWFTETNTSKLGRVHF